ncbi:MAG: SagB/ThcOx family dehydrogenase [Polyangia bacterium]
MISQRDLRRRLSPCSRLLALLTGIGAACNSASGADLSGGSAGEPPQKKNAGAANEAAGLSGELAPPDENGGPPLNWVLAARRSLRDFGPAELERDELAQLLWAGQGVTSKRKKRTAPSAGALYPLELHAVTPEGVLRYLPERHRAQQLAAGDRRAKLAKAALGQSAVAGAAVDIVVAGVVERTAKKYGDRAGRYVAIEAGCAGQNILLEAEALGLGGVWIGAYDDEKVAALAELPQGAVPYGILAIGRPR